jgi:hypothetical protein
MLKAQQEFDAFVELTAVGLMSRLLMTALI